MNIQQAKEQITYTVKSYFTRDDKGEWMIPTDRQRPILVVGPPGIGKTAIINQIAKELQVGLVTYSMTKHIRQSILGLPFISKKTYGGKKYSVLEYTTSEIIAAVYERIEKHGAKEGILFLDEINCISEKLEPSMLQFLQYKVFGRHRIPEGWILVMAGNTPGYDNFVREFDMVIRDRLKCIEIEPDYGVWKRYAYERGVHSAVITYLERNKEDFYVVETKVNSKQFVTSRGWVDLSDMIKLYEMHGFKMDENLVIQYLHNKTIAKQFAVYYDLFDTYRSVYEIDSILDGTASQNVKDRAKVSRFDERLSLVGMLLDAIYRDMRSVGILEAILGEMMSCLKELGDQVGNGNNESVLQLLENATKRLRDEVTVGKVSGIFTSEALYAKERAGEIIDNIVSAMEEKEKQEGKVSFKEIRRLFDVQNVAVRKSAEEARKHLNNTFVFMEEVFHGVEELLIFVTELGENESSATFIKRYGCKKYVQHHKELLFYEQQTEIIRQMDELE